MGPLRFILIRLKWNQSDFRISYTMNKHILGKLPLLLLFCAGCVFQRPPNELLHAPAGNRYVELNIDGETVLPNGRIVTPLGAHFRIHPHPYGLTISPDGRWVVTANSGNPLTLSILDLADADNPQLHQIPENPVEDPDVLASSFMGLAIDAESKTLYVAGGKDWSLLGFDLESRERLFRIDCDHETPEGRFQHGFLGDLRLSRDGKRIYGVDQSNFRMLTIDLVNQKVENSIAVGRHPFGIELSTDGTRAYVANVGMFEYAYHRDADGNIAKLAFPAAGVPSKEAEQGQVVQGITVPGLGDPNDIAGMSVWTVDISKPREGRVLHKTKTGHLVGEELEDFPAVGGSSPNSIVATASFIYVSNGSNDSISVIDAATGSRVRDIDISLDDRVKHLRGMIPFGLALSPDEKHLYVAEAGINAVGVIRLSDEKTLGHIPTAWFPSKLSVSPDGKRLYVASAKGIGSGPNAGPDRIPSDPTGIGDLMRGYISVIDLEDAASRLDELSATVLRNNVTIITRADETRPKGHPVPAYRGAWKSPIKHVIYVTKENRTYDEIFGVLEQGRGDAELCRLGRPITVRNKDGSQEVKDVLLMPNHIALARRFAVNDNFYCDSDHSVDGHRWLVGTYPNEFMEARIGQSAEGDGPGNFSFIGSSGAIYPEDYNEAGSIWEHFQRGDVEFRNYGLGFEFKPQDETADYPFTGVRLPINYPMPKALLDNTSRRFATYNTNIPDQFRMDMFEKEFEARWLSGREPFPSVITMMLPNDHGAGERPEAGYSYWGSYMSDNDLALGRLVELISNSPFWKETVILVTEDDAQGYRDTVDAHRSICMVISPYAKRDHVSHTHTSTASMLKTMFLIHGLPSLNQYDAFANDLVDSFTLDPLNSEPYEALPVDARVFDPAKALDPYDEDFDWERLMEFVPLDDQNFLDSDRYGHSGEAGHGERD